MTRVASRHSRRFFLQAAAAAGIGLAGRAQAAEKVRPNAQSVLLVVDMQNCFVEGGTLPVKGGAEILPIVNALGGAFTNVVVTQDWHTPEHSSFASVHSGKKPFQSTPMPYGQQVLWPDHCVQGTEDAALLDGLKLPHAQLVLRKGFHRNVDSYSAFEEADRKTSTGLAAYLRARNINTVFICGLATDFCVAWSALDARKAGFTTYVIENATRGIDLNGSLAEAWKQMTAAGVKRIQFQDVYGI